MMKSKKNINKLLTTKHGLMLCNKNDEYVGQALIRYGEYSEEEVMLFDTLCKDADTVIEVGANFGSHTLALSKMVGEKGKVIAFEPQRVVFQTLCANICLNNLTNVFCFQKAVSSKKSKLFLPPINYKKQGNFGGVSMQNRGVEEVEVIKLDKLLDIKQLKLIKIDAEGMELEVLKSAKKTIKKFLPFLYVENDRFDKHEKLVSYIDALGYILYWHITPLYNKNNFFKKKKNIFGALVSSNMLCIPKTLNINPKNFKRVNIKDKHPLDY